ncbi:MAG: hypothetical protein J0H29_05070 [Sphingobacteriales bacterium]|nr:hypothetical protein [Sphingobacteriales bacterium]OJY86203.1 MAG: hypothetical protein BGP14_17165 [Sphingobacteriales bacterium 44-15]
MAKTHNKKVLRKKIQAKLEESFPEIKVAVGDKKFVKKIRKAGKILAAGAVTKLLRKALKKTKAKAATNKKASS